MTISERFIVNIIGYMNEFYLGESLTEYSSWKCDLENFIEL